LILLLIYIDAFIFIDMYGFVTIRNFKI
jgi:hypothetical protein